MSSSEFISKIDYYCHKKESLFNQSKSKYAIRSMFAGAFLTFSTAGDAIGADLLNNIVPSSGYFLFPFVFAWGLVYIVFLNAELVTSNMMYLTAGVYQKNIRLSKAVTILLYCGIFNLIGAMIIGAAFAYSAAFNAMDVQHFIVHLVQGKATRGNGQVLLEAILANIFVNVAILAFLLIKDETAKMWIIISAIFMFVFLGEEHVVANFASFSIVKFSAVSPSLEFMNWFNLIRHWVVAFIGNTIGGGVIVGLAYAFLNKTKSVYHE